MSINLKPFPITMELNETDLQVLNQFIYVNRKIVREFSEEYLILFNFATDCIYAQFIQPELIKVLLPFYLKAMEEAVLHENEIAMDIYNLFNTAMFFNQKNFKCAVGEKSYFQIMQQYIKLTIQKMERYCLYMSKWISLFNTTIAICNDNIQQLFFQIFHGSLEVKCSFFQYLSVLLFKESDNIFILDSVKEFWTSDIWNFDEGYFSQNIFWNDEIVKIFDQEINRTRIEILFHELKTWISTMFDLEFIDLFSEEMNYSFVTGVFSDRKMEYLKKINSKSNKDYYWDQTF